MTRSTAWWLIALLVPLLATGCTGSLSLGDGDTADDDNDDTADDDDDDTADDDDDDTADDDDDDTADDDDDDGCPWNGVYAGMTETEFVTPQGEVMLLMCPTEMELGACSLTGIIVCEGPGPGFPPFDVIGTASEDGDAGGTVSMTTHDGQIIEFPWEGEVTWDVLHGWFENQGMPTLSGEFELMPMDDEWGDEDP